MAVLHTLLAVCRGISLKVKLSNNLLVAVLQAMLAVCRGINMMNVTINPLEGISIDNKKVNLGMSRAEVASILGKADGVFDRNYVDEELKNANHWATVGLGRVGYYK